MNMTYLIRAMLIPLSAAPQNTPARPARSEQTRMPDA